MNNKCCFRNQFSKTVSSFCIPTSSSLTFLEQILNNASGLSSKDCFVLVDLISGWPKNRVEATTNVDKQSYILNINMSELQGTRRKVLASTWSGRLNLTSIMNVTTMADWTIPIICLRSVSLTTSIVTAAAAAAKMTTTDHYYWPSEAISQWRI